MKELAERAAQNPNRFLEFVLTDSDGEGIVQAPIHEAIQAHIDWCHVQVRNQRGKLHSRRHAGIVAPFGHGKTEQVAIGRTLKEIGHNRRLRIKIICNNADSAQSRSEAVKNHIESSDAYHCVFPDVTPDPQHWAMGSWRVQRDIISKDATVETHGVFSSKGLGSRADLLIFDDVCDMKDIFEPSVRKKKIEMVNTQWMSRLKREGGRVIYIATAYHEHDLTHQLVRNAQWSFLWMAVSQDLTGIDCVLHNADETHPLWRM